MRVFASAAITADGYLDDNSAERLTISTPQDWERVYALRARHDAILVGAETLRRDNPSLMIRDEELRDGRATQGLKTDIAKITLTASGNIDPGSYFFTRGDADRYIFSPKPLPQFDGLAEVIVGQPVTARLIVTELEKRGIERLFVEGGAQTLRMFFAEGLVDTFRLARNPSLRLGAERGGARLEIGDEYLSASCTTEHIEGMEVAVYEIHPDTTGEDMELLRMAVDEAHRCTPSAASYCVGAVVRTADGAIFKGYTHETSATRHAEQEAAAKALAAGADLRGAAMYSSMEPCSERRSEPESCSQMMLRLGFAKAVFALYEPDCFVKCLGALNLRAGGVEVRVYPALGEEVKAVNSHICR